MDGENRLTLESLPEGKQLENALKWITGTTYVERRKPDLPDKTLHSVEYDRIREEASSWAQLSPLIAATLGPLAVLLGIPCLTQPWHGVLIDPPVRSNGWLNYEPLPDPRLNLILAGITLFCEVMGNFLLILRFSNFHVQITTWLSFIFWILKIILGIVNYIQFGIANQQKDMIIYLEGYWVGICSMGITVIIILFLMFNLIFLHSQSKDATRRFHHVQREFMIQTLSFFVYIGIIALMFCRIEHYTYVESIYYMIVTTLTIGFGDITPKTTIFKVLTFPFTIIGITLLALIVTSIVRILDDRERRRKSALKNPQEKEKENGSKFRPQPRLERTSTLQEEVVRLREEEWRRERRSNLQRVGVGLTVFLTFWFIGAIIFHLVEPLSYGNALYFCYIVFLTIGFGDFTPTTEASRPIFIVYALLAVPTMTVVIDAVSTNITAFMVQHVHRIQRQVYQDKDFEIQSLSSLITIAKQKTLSTDDSVKLHGLTERVTANLHHMHQHVQKLLGQKLGSGVRQIIAAEREYQSVVDKGKVWVQDQCREDEIPVHLSEIGKSNTDELEFLMLYRELYALIMADLLIVKENLAKLETQLQTHEKGQSKSQLTDEIEEIGQSFKNMSEALA